MTYDELIEANSIAETKIESDTTAYFGLNVVVPLSATGTPPGTYVVSIISIKEEDAQMDPLFFHHQDYWDSKKITVSGDKTTSADLKRPTRGDSAYAGWDASVEDVELVELGEPSWSGGSTEGSLDNPNLANNGEITSDISVENIIVKEGQLTVKTQGKKIKMS